MILTIAATTIVISKFVFYLTAAGAATAGVGATILVNNMTNPRNQAEEVEIQQIEETGRERNAKRGEHLDDIVTSTIQETTHLSTETSAHTTKIAFNLNQLDKGVSQIDRETQKLMETNTSLVSASAMHDQQMQDLLSELRAKIALLLKASQELDLAKTALLEKEQEISTIQHQLDLAQKSIVQLEMSLGMVQSENRDKGEKILALEKNVENMSGELSATELKLRLAGQKISDLVSSKRPLLETLKSSQQIIDNLTLQLEQAQETPKRIAQDSRPGFFA